MIMNRIAKFRKVSYHQFKKDWMNTIYANNPNIKDLTSQEIDLYNIYENIEIPTRSTKDSAGYDFRVPCELIIGVGESINVPTGICCEMNEGWVLNIFPRSGQGFKTGIHLANTVGIIDGDYVNSDNEGHIFVKLINDSAIAKEITIKKGDGFCQGIFLPFGITVDDNVQGVRNGGFGSTNRESNDNVKIFKKEFKNV